MGLMSMFLKTRLAEVPDEQHEQEQPLFGVVLQ